MFWYDLQEAHIAKLKEALDAGGDASLQNGLDLAVAALKTVPPYGHREVHPPGVTCPAVPSCFHASLFHLAFSWGHVLRTLLHHYASLWAQGGTPSGHVILLVTIHDLLMCIPCCCCWLVQGKRRWELVAHL